MVNKLTVLDWVTLVLAIVGGLNWGLVGAFKYDLVAALLGGEAGVEGVVARVVYVLVGLAALYLVFVVSKLARK